MPYDDDRAPVFLARFDSDCPACGDELAEGDQASWLNGEAVHRACADEAGVETFVPRALRDEIGA